MASNASLRSSLCLFTCAFIFYEVRDRYDPLGASQVADDALQNPLGVILSHDGCYLNNSSSDSSHALRVGVSCSLTYITSRTRRCHRHLLLYGLVIKSPPWRVTGSRGSWCRDVLPRRDGRSLHSRRQAATTATTPAPAAAAAAVAEVARQ